MRYQIQYAPNAKKQLKKIRNKDVLRINESINRLAYNPSLGKKLKGELNGYYSLRVWPYRVIYCIYQQKLIIFVVHVAHRQGVYK